MRNAIANKDYDAIVVYWMILELISVHEDRVNRPGYARIAPSYLAALTHSNERGVRTLLLKIKKYFGESLIIVWGKFEASFNHVSDKFQPCLEPVSDEFVQFFCVNWLNFQEARGGKRTPKNKVCALEVRSKSKEDKKEEGEETSSNFSFRENKFYKRVGAELRKQIETLYPEDFLNFAMVEIQGYLETKGYQQINNLDSFIPSNLHSKWQFKQNREKAQAPKKAAGGMVETL